MDIWYTEKHTPNSGITFKVKRCLFHKDTEYQRLDVLETYEFGKILTLDGLVMLTERDEFVYHEMITHVPLITHSDPKRVLIIGGGDGGTVREALLHSSLASVELVEIDNDVIEASKVFFPELSIGFKDPKVKISNEDGIEFIKKRHNIYDIIIIDSTDPIGPAKGLFTKDFYKTIYDALTPNGLMVTQSESPFTDSKLWFEIYNNISSVFPKALTYLAFIPTYPAGMWSFTMGSKTFDPISDMRSDYAEVLSQKTKYYNMEIHKSAFALPNFMKSYFKK